MYIVTHRNRSESFSCPECADPSQSATCDCFHRARAASKWLGVGAVLTRNGRVLAHNTTARSAIAKADRENDAADGITRPKRQRGSLIESARRGNARSARGRKAA